MTNINIDKKTATCSNCGEVNIVIKSNVWRCSNGNRLQKKHGNKKYKNKKYIDRPDVCEVCGSNNRICYDHDHASGNHRGWLCNSCNLALGYAKDNPNILRDLAIYLEK